MNFNFRKILAKLLKGIKDIVGSRQAVTSMACKQQQSPYFSISRQTKELIKQSLELAKTYGTSNKLSALRRWFKQVLVDPSLTASQREAKVCFGLAKVMAYLEKMQVPEIGNLKHKLALINNKTRQTKSELCCNLESRLDSLLQNFITQSKTWSAYADPSISSLLNSAKPQTLLLNFEHDSEYQDQDIALEVTAPTSTFSQVLATKPVTSAPTSTANKAKYKYN